jgi:radical SAM superfamily enzyme YgiQ (UPF0313 family)
MRVLLINPFYPISETPSPPLGLAYLAAALEEAGAEVRVLDCVVHPYGEAVLREALDEFRPAIVGATAVTMNVGHAVRVIEDVKRIAPVTLTVMGGPHATFSAEETFAACAGLDVIVLGEGERTVVELARCVATGGALGAVAGIAYRSGPGIRFTPEREFIRDLDALPLPARRLLPLGRYRALGMPISMTTSRGCPFQCIFCVGRKMVGARVRYRSPRLVVDELEQVSRLGFHQVNIADDLFTADKGHCLAVCAEILRRGLAVKWTSFARVDTVSVEVLERMKAAGCTAVSFGIESANPGILKTIKKGITLAQVEAAVRMCAKAGVTPFASFILGLPGETPETIAETMAFGKRLQEIGLLYGFHLLAPFPGTEVRERSADLGLRILTDEWSRYHANRAVVETETVSREMLDAVALEWETEFNRYLGDIKTRMQRGEATPEEAHQVVNLERIVLVYELMMNRVIEEAGTWAEADGDGAGEGLAGLVARAAAKSGAERSAVKDALDNALRRDDLVCERRSGRVRWRWRDHL